MVLTRQTFLACLAEDDADLVVDYAANTLSGVWDDGDVSDLEWQWCGNGAADPNDSKPLTSFLDALKGGELYLQVHTNRFDAATGFPGEIRSQIIADATGGAAETPEPLSALGLMAAAGAAGMVLRRRFLGWSQASCCRSGLFYLVARADFSVRANVLFKRVIGALPVPPACFYCCS